MHWSERLERVRKQRHWTQKELAQRAGVEYASLRKYAQGEIHRPRGDIVKHLAKALGVSPLWLEHGEGPPTNAIAIVGEVGAGETFYPADTGTIDELTLDFARLDLIAVTIRGSSGLPVYRPGEVVVCSRAAGQSEAGFLNTDCILMTREGAGYLKRPVRGSKPGLYSLLSYNAPTIDDVVVDWAAPVVFVVRHPGILRAI